MGYWKKPKKCRYKKEECVPYGQFFSTQSQTISAGQAVTFNECEPVCGMELDCPSVVTVSKSGVYFFEFELLSTNEEAAYAIEVNDVVKRNSRFGSNVDDEGSWSGLLSASGLLYIPCGATVRLININDNTDNITNQIPSDVLVNSASLTLFLVQKKELKKC